MASLVLEPLPRFIAQIVAIVLIARIIGRLTRRFGQPMVIAEITAGILLGPSVLGWLWPELSRALFAPESLELLQVVSNLGLALFMFLIGLELDPSLSRGRGRASLIVSQATLVVPLGLGILLALYLHRDPALVGSDVSPTAFALFLGAALSITAFPVLARILAERRLLRSRVGTVTITCAAIDDVIAWCLLAFVLASASLPATAGASGLQEAAMTSLLSIGYVAIMLVVVRPLLQRWARPISTRGELTHDLVAVVMLLLFASAWATELIGIHALFGAFLLGAILPREGGLAHALADKLEDLVVVVLLPLFFAYSGVRTQIGLLDSNDAWITCALVIAVACVGKFGAGTLAARLTGLSWRESGALGILMNTRGLMVLIVLNIGLDVGIISPTLFTMMVIMALFTTFIATPVFDAIYPVDQHVADLLAASGSAEPDRPPTQEPPFTLLLCLLDERPGRGLLALANALADARPDARMHALHLRRPDAPTSEHANPAGAALEAGVKRMSFVSAEPVRDICRVAGIKAADLVLLEREWPREHHPVELLDATARRVMVECSTDVAILFDGGAERVTRVLLIASESIHDRPALELTRRLLEGGAELTIQRGARASSSRLGAGAARPHSIDEFVQTTRRARPSLRDGKASPLDAITDGSFDLVVLALDDAEHQLLRDCLALPARGLSLLVVHAAPEPDASESVIPMPGSLHGPGRPRARAL